MDKKILKKEMSEAVKQLILMDDIFSKKIFEDKKCTELVVRIILNRYDIVVERVKTEYVVNNLNGRGIRMDIYAIDKDNSHINIEIQVDDGGAVPRRARYNSSIIDAGLTLPGDKYKDLPETYVIFITKNDVLGGGLPLYSIDRTIAEMGNKSFGDGSHIIYVNGECKDPETALGKLMQDFFCPDPDKMNYTLLADRTRLFKENKEESGSMSRIIDELIAKGKAEGRAEGRAEGAAAKTKDFAEKLLRGTDFSLEKISELTGLSSEKVSELKSSMSKPSAT